MSEKEDVSPSSQDSAFCLGDSGSFYALQVALQTMKGLCQQQRDQISVLEEENQKLRSAVGQLKESSFQLSRRNLHLNQTVHQRKQEIQNMQAQLTSLSQQQTSLASQMARTSGENQRLKNELVHLSQLNASLSLGCGSPNKGESASVQVGADENDESTVCEVQGTDDNCETDGNTVQELMRQKQIFQDMKLLLLGQQTKLKKNMQFLTLLMQKGQQLTAHMSSHPAGTQPQIVDEPQDEIRNSFHSVHLEDEFEALRVWGTPQPSIQQRSSSSLETGTTLRVSAPSSAGVWGNPDRPRPPADLATDTSAPPEDAGGAEDKVCPICGAMFYRPCPFEAFENHVTSHFDDEESLLGQFEVVPQNL